MRSTVPFVVFLLVCPLSSLAYDSANDLRLVNSSERVIVSEFSKALSVSLRITKGNCGPACDETGMLEMAIGLIGLSRSDVAAKALVNLTGLRLDGAASEELGCQILIRGKSLLGRLERIRAEDVVRHCQTEFKDARKRALRLVLDVEVDQVCRSESEILAYRDELISVIKAGESCGL